MHDQVRPETATERYVLAAERQEIEYLRRLYAKATDMLGITDDFDARAEATEIYRGIFSPDVKIKVTGATSVPLSGGSADDWVEVVVRALGKYASTQHLIGTQVVTFKDVDFSNVPSASPTILVSGEASMTTYLQAWHVWPDRRLRVVMGVYIDEVKYFPDLGWRIVDMNLVHTVVEHRELGAT